MNLGELADTISDSKVTGFALDHRKVAPGNVFGAFRGTRFNGEDFIAEAIKRGASAVVARPEAKVEGVPHLADACVGSISEIFDAEPPYTPRGCVAQAWSVAEVLRCWLKTRG